MRCTRLRSLVVAIATLAFAGYDTGCAVQQVQRDVNTSAAPIAELTVISSIPTRIPAQTFSVDQFNNFYLLSQSRNTLLKLSARGDSITTIAGSGSDHYQLQSPSSIDAHLTNRIYIADEGNHRIEVYNKDLGYITTISPRLDPIPERRFEFPRGVAADDAGNVYVIDQENSRIVKYTPSLTFDRAIGSASSLVSPQAQLHRPLTVTTDAARHLYVSDAVGIVAYDEFGNYLARASLSTVPTAFTTSADTLFAFNAVAREVALYRSVTLEQIGTWKINTSAPHLRSIFFRNGMYALLSDSSIEQLSNHFLQK